MGGSGRELTCRGGDNTVGVEDVVQFGLVYIFGLEYSEVYEVEDRFKGDELPNRDRTPGSPGAGSTSAMFGCRDCAVWNECKSCRLKAAGRRKMGSASQ